MSFTHSGTVHKQQQKKAQNPEYIWKKEVQVKITNKMHYFLACTTA